MEELVSIVLVVAVMFGVGLAGWSIRDTYISNRWKKRFVGRLEGESIIYVLDNIGYSISRELEKPDKVELSSSLSSYNTSHERDEWLSFSIEVKQGSPFAETLHEIYKAGSMQLEVRPFIRENKPTE